jgi:lysophospholipase L1-like esterase
VRVNGLSYWGHWLILAGGLIFFIVLGKVLPPGWERIELPEQVDTFALPIPAWEGEPLRAQVPPPARPSVRKDKVASQTDTLPGADAPERILLIGDSMIEWLRLRLARWCRSSGYALYTVIWPSSNLIWWGKSDTLTAFIHKFRPTYVLICVGGNELFIPYIQKRKPYLERILAQIGELPYVWIGPPNWKEDTGINQLIREAVGPRRFYESRRLTLERLEDGAHPTPTAAYRWADSLVVFLRDSALFPLSFPDTLVGPRTALPHLTILLPPHEP